MKFLSYLNQRTLKLLVCLIGVKYIIKIISFDVNKSFFNYFLHFKGGKPSIRLQQIQLNYFIFQLLFRIKSYPEFVQIDFNFIS